MPKSYKLCTARENIHPIIKKLKVEIFNSFKDIEKNDGLIGMKEIYGGYTDKENYVESKCVAKYKIKGLSDDSYYEIITQVERYLIDLLKYKYKTKCMNNSNITEYRGNEGDEIKFYIHYN